MAKFCPMTGFKALCTRECAWRTDDGCAVLDIANSFKHREIQKEVFSKISNMRYGTLSTDFIRKEENNEESGRDV